MAWSKDNGRVAKVNADYAKQQAEYAKQQAENVKAKGDYAQQIADENKTRFLPAVETVALRNSTYPNPQHGDTVRVTSEAATYRYDRTSGWVLTDKYNATAIDEVAAQLAHINAKLSGTVYVDAYAHLKNGNDWSPVLQYIASNLGQAEIVLPNETIELHSQTTFTTSRFKLRGQPNTKIVNNTGEQVNTLVALFYLQGSKTAYTSTVTSNVIEGNNVIPVTNASEFKVGDYVAFQGFFSTQNISVVEAVDTTNNTITLDRSFYYPINASAAIYKINAVEDIEITDLDFDFNGQYGYGVFVSHGRNVTTKRIKGVNVGSKVVQYNNSFDCLSEDISGTRGLNNLEGGHSYVMRYAVSNDCTAHRIKGRNMRHVVDFSGASRNTIYDSEGYFNTSADFLTHANHCRDNMFIDCKSVNNPIAAYSFNPTLKEDAEAPGGDVGNIVQGGVISGSPIVYHKQDGSNIFKGITIKNTKTYTLKDGGTLLFEGCHFVLDAALMFFAANNADVTFLNCKFKVNVNLALGSMTNATGVINVLFDNCDIDCNYVGTVLAMPTNGSLIFKNSNVKAVDNAANFPPFISKGKVIAKNSFFSFVTSGISFIGVQGAASLEMDGCSFKNASGIYRIYNIGQSALLLGMNKRENATYDAIGNFLSFNTVGSVDINSTAIPTLANAVVGARVRNNNPTSGGYEGWVYTSAGWKGYGLIA